VIAESQKGLWGTPNLILGSAGFSKNAIKFFWCYFSNTNMATYPLPHVQRELCSFRVTSRTVHCLYYVIYIYFQLYIYTVYTWISIYIYIFEYVHYLQFSSTVCLLKKMISLHCSIKNKNNQPTNQPTNQLHCSTSINPRENVKQSKIPRYNHLQDLQQWHYVGWFGPAGVWTNLNLENTREST